MTERERDRDEVDGVTERGGDGGRYFNLKWTGDSCTGGAASWMLGIIGEAVGERIGTGRGGERS